MALDFGLINVISILNLILLFTFGNAFYHSESVIFITTLLTTQWNEFKVTPFG